MFSINFGFLAGQLNSYLTYIKPAPFWPALPVLIYPPSSALPPLLGYLSMHCHRPDDSRRSPAHAVPRSTLAASLCHAPALPAPLCHVPLCHAPLCQALRSARPPSPTPSPVHPQNVRFQNVRFQNVRFTKRQVYKMSGLQNVRSSKRPVTKKYPYIFCTCGWWKSAGSVSAMFASKVMAVFYSLF